MDCDLHLKLLAVGLALLASAAAQAASLGNERPGISRAYRPDATDIRALKELRRAVERAGRLDRENGLSNALKALSVKHGITALPDETLPEARSENTVRIRARRPATVSRDEWQTFTRIRREVAQVQTESSYINFELLDVNGDGRRDLVVDIFDTMGIANFIYVLHRKRARFVNPIGSPSSEPVGNNNEFYLVNSRGANQGAYWVKLQGRIYAAYFDGIYGADRIQLLRPLRRNQIAPTLTVRYAYTLKIPRRQVQENGKPGPELTTAQQRSLQEGLGTLLSPLGLPRYDTVGEPLCPAPAGMSEEKMEEYRGFGPGHSTYEAVGDFPVWYGRECRIGRLVSFFGTYRENGLIASLWVRDIDGSQPEEDFKITGRRRIIGIESSIAKVERN